MGLKNCGISKEIIFHCNSLISTKFHSSKDPKVLLVSLSITTGKIML